MEGFTKIPNTVFELGLTPSQFTVLCNLIRAQSYRAYKGEIEDGWFAKSQNELAKECGFGSHNTLTKILQGMSKNGILQIKSAKAVTYFKIDMGKMAMGQNEHMSNNDIVGMSNNDICQKMTMPKIEDMSNNDIVGMSNNDYLHNNINNNIKQDNYINLDNTVDTSTSTNNKTTDIENKDKEKEVYDIACMTSNQKENKVEATGSKVKEILDNFKKGDNTRFPTMDELRAIFIKENIYFTDEDFKDNSSGVVDGKYKLSPKNATMSVCKYLRNAIKNHGFLYDSDNKDIQNAVISYINKNK